MKNEDLRDLSGYSMPELFLMEVETQSGAISEGLLILENNPERIEVIPSLMRGAHSIKGAARIVQIEAGVRMAHAMEDCFLAARDGRIAIDAKAIDLLLRGVDMLKQIAHANTGNYSEWFDDHEESILALITALTALIESSRQNAAGLPAMGFSPHDPHRSESFPDNLTPVGELRMRETAADPFTKPARYVRVTEEKLQQLMALAGESLVENKRLRPFSKSLLQLRVIHSELAKVVDHIREEVEPHTTNEHIRLHFHEIQQKFGAFRNKFNELYNEFEHYARRSANLTNRLFHEVVASKMRPFSDGVQEFPRMMRDLARQLNKSVKFKIFGKSTQVDRDILDKLESPITQLLRNAIDHGIESAEERKAQGKNSEGSILLEASHSSGILSVIVSDDGRGVDPVTLKNSIIRNKLADAAMVEKLSDAEMLDFLFLPGFTTSNTINQLSGRGIGLDVVQTMVQEVGGVIRVRSKPREGMTFHLQLPLTLSILRSLVTVISDEPYAVPLARIDRLLLIPKTDIETIENRLFLNSEHHQIELIYARQILELPMSSLETDNLSIIVLNKRGKRYGLVVDRFVDERNLIVRPLNPRLGKIADISAASVLSDGSPVLILDVDDLLYSMEKNFTAIQRKEEDTPANKQRADRRKKRILVVDDSLTVREVERKLLENHGFDVDIAVDGMDALNAAHSQRFDLIITDLDMPRMNGFELVQQLKSNVNIESPPIMVVSYKDRERDRIRAQNVGADYFLAKSGFHDQTVLQIVSDLIGKSEA